MKQFKHIKSKGSNKLHLDQYYTSEEVMTYCVNKTLDILQANGYEISEFLEPSAGQGVFSDYLYTKGKNVIALDIEPKGVGIVQANYLEYNLDYKRGRLIIGNPPFGPALNLAKMFYKKSIQLGDYISFILPISQLNNRNSMYEFDLLYSEDLGNQIFSGDREVHCCLNVYVRPKNGLNKKKVTKLKDVEIVRPDSKGFKTFEYDLRMCYWGTSAGRILSEDERYSAVYKIKIHNDSLRDAIIQTLKTAVWDEELKYTATPTIPQFRIVELLKRNISEIS